MEIVLEGVLTGKGRMLCFSGMMALGKRECEQGWAPGEWEDGEVSAPALPPRAEPF